MDLVPSSGRHSLWMLFLQADPVVQGVMLLLLAASVACWTIILDKSVRLARARGRALHFARATVDGRLASDLTAAGSIAGDIQAAGLRAAHDEEDDESRADRRLRIERAMRAAMAARLKEIESGLSWLATVGSTAPFVGLFGTVWGIMNSFTAIAASRDTSLAVVAPGIAEALFATALGLVAAIPAVVAYNKFSASLSGTAHQLNFAIGNLGDRLSRSTWAEDDIDARPAIGQR